MVKQVARFETTDGKEFKDEAAANAHQMGLDNAEKIEGYITAAGLQKAQAGLLRKHIAAFKAYEATGQVPSTQAAEDEGAEGAEGAASPEA